MESEPPHEPSLARRIYGSSPRIVTSAPYSLSRITEVVEGINQVHGQFEVLTHADSSPAYRMFVHAQDAGRRLVGLPSLYTTYHELFVRNIRNMDQLCGIADAVFLGAETEYEHLKATVDESMDQQEQQYQTRKRLEATLPGVLDQHRALCALMQGMRPGDEKGGKSFFTLKRERLELERTIDVQGKGVYALVLERESGQVEIGQFYEHMERLFRTAYVLSMRIKAGSADITEALRNTHRAYAQFDNLFRASVACQQGLSSLAQFHHRLNTHFEGGLRDLQGILHEDENLRLFSTSNPQLGQLITEIEQIEARRTVEQERQVRRHAP
ncbi:MAG: hypothetical protein Q7S65_01180 [Nanoarchaeota archaeon]|nr:hypothetical protein [Nanoarchaeota archaeon]